MDSEKFFDTVCQSKLIKVLSRTSKDGRVISLIHNYADDGIMHFWTKEEAVFIKEKLARRFEECKLELHPVKTKIVYYKDRDRTRKEEFSEVDLIEYMFKAAYIKCRDGKIRYNFIALVSNLHLRVSETK